jgi:hypothetical protein
MYGSAVNQGQSSVIWGQTMEKVQKECGILRTLLLAIGRFHFAEGFDNLRRSKLTLGRLSRKARFFEKVHKEFAFLRT